MTTYLSFTAQQALQQTHYVAKGNRLFLPRERLDEKVYREVKEVCTRLGGRWNTSSQAFLFPSDPTEALAWVCESGEMPPRNPYAFFQTPDPISEQMLRCGFELFPCNQCEGYRHDQPLHFCQYLPANLRILEPSAGQGAIARWVRQLYSSLGRVDYTLHCCELSSVNQALLHKQGFQVVASNFLEYHPEGADAFYDVILMNPPFQGHEYIEHIEHAWTMLHPREGHLVAITPTGFTWHSDVPCRRLSSLVCRYGDEPPISYPAGTFRASGTAIKTMLISLIKRDFSWKDGPYEGYPDWYCFMLDLFITQTQSLSNQRQTIWQRLDAGELADDPAQPGWEKMRALLSALFTQAAEQAREAWIEIRLDEKVQRRMERVFFTHGMAECQCERQRAMRQQWSTRPCDRPLSVASPAPGLAEGSSSMQPRKNVLAPATLPTPEECVQLPLFSTC